MICFAICHWKTCEHWIPFGNVYLLPLPKVNEGKFQIGQKSFGCGVLSRHSHFFVFTWTSHFRRVWNSYLTVYYNYNLACRRFPKWQINFHIRWQTNFKFANGYFLCHFKFCHNRKKDFCKDILADSILFYIASYFARKNGPPLCIWSSMVKALKK